MQVEPDHIDAIEHVQAMDVAALAAAEVEHPVAGLQAELLQPNRQHRRAIAPRRTVS